MQGDIRTAEDAEEDAPEDVPVMGSEVVDAILRDTEVDNTVQHIEIVHTIMQIMRTWDQIITKVQHLQTR